MAVNLPDDVAERLAAEAARRGQDVDRLAAELLAATLPTTGPPEASERSPKRRLVFGAIGRSGSGRRATEVDEMLAEGFGRD